MSEPRKATDVLLEIESTVKVLVEMVRSLDLNNKILSNKLNVLMQKQVNPTPQPTFTATAVDDKPIIQIQATTTPLVDTSSEGDRRISRPETYQPIPKQKMILVPKKEETAVFTMVDPPKKEIIKEPAKEILQNNASKNAFNNLDNKLPVTQRVIDKNGKVVFLADVLIVDAETNEQIEKLRTRGNGVWMASMFPGNYIVTISKLESLNKQKMISKQTIKVDGFTSPLELPPVVLK